MRYKKSSESGLCDVLGCGSAARVLMPSVELPRQLCAEHGEAYMRAKLPKKAVEEIDRINKKFAAKRKSDGAKR